MNMKTRTIITSRVLCAALLCGCSMAGRSQDGEASKFPHVVAFEIGDGEFVARDDISIHSVRGTQPGFAVGASYCVRGEYTLASKAEAELSLFVTTTNSAPTEVEPRQTVRVQKGSGPFTLVIKLSQPGFPHLTFYPAAGGNGFGGVYFGAGSWLLRQKGFSYAETHPVVSDEQSASPEPASKPEATPTLNQAIYEYLGSPVPVPASLGKAYTKEGLISAMRLVAQKAGVTPKHIEIDDSEFPFLVGLITAEGAFDKMLEQLKLVAAYEHQGGVSSSTCRAINIIPWRAYPSESAQRIARRIIVRENMLYDKLSKIETSLSAAGR
jgi:hypothetical protein